MMLAGGVALLSLALGSAADGARLPVPAAPPGVALGPVPGMSLERPTATRWYGWELMLSDAVFTTLAWRSGWSGGVLIGSAVGVTLGTPLIHVLNGNGVAGMRSIIVRSSTWLVALGAAIAQTAGGSSNCASDSCPGPRPTVAVGILVAGGVFALIDDTVLAAVSAAPDDPDRRVALARSFAPTRFVPTLSPTAGGATMGLGGVF
jgi:hypothetical protein